LANEHPFQKNTRKTSKLLPNPLSCVRYGRIRHRFYEESLAFQPQSFRPDASMSAQNIGGKKNETGMIFVPRVQKSYNFPCIMEIFDLSVKPLCV